MNLSIIIVAIIGILCIIISFIMIANDKTGADGEETEGQNVWYVE